MRRVAEHYECTHCGAVVEGVAANAKFMAVIAQSSGKPAGRSILVDGREVHRCEIRLGDGPRPN